MVILQACWFTLSYMNKAGFRLACHSLHFIAWSLLAVSELQLAAAKSSWIEVNCLWPAAVGKAARLLIDWLDAAHRLVFTLWRVVLVQLYKNHHQSGSSARGKLVWKQHKAYLQVCVEHPVKYGLVSSIKLNNVRLKDVKHKSGFSQTKRLTGQLLIN